MRDNASSKVKQGINKLMKLKTKKSSKKVITEDFYHPSEEKKTNNFKLLSDADLHVKNLLSKYLLTIDRTEHTFDVVNKLKHLEEQKNKKPKLKLFDLSEEDDKDDNSMWGKSKTKGTSKRQNNTMLNPNNPSNHTTTSFQRFFTKKNDKLNSFNRKQSKHTKQRSSNINDNSFGEDDEHYTKTKSYQTSSTLLLQNEDNDSDDKTLIERSETVKLSEELYHSNSNKEPSSHSTIKHYFTKGNTEKQYIRKTSTRKSKREPRSERIINPIPTIIDDKENYDENDIRNIIPLDKQYFKEFNGICSKLQDTINLKPLSPKNKNTSNKKNKASSQFYSFPKVSAPLPKKEKFLEEMKIPLKERNNQSEKESNGHIDSISQEDLHPKESVHNILSEENLLENNANEVDESGEEKRIEEMKYRVLTRKPQPVYDSISDEEESDEEIIESGYIEPFSNLRLTYDCVLFLLEIYSLIYVPITLAFKLNEPIKINFPFLFNIFVDCVFFFDIILSFFTAYYDFDEQLVTEIEQIALNYLNTWFIVDFITGIPFNSILDLIRYFAPFSEFTRSTETLFTSNSFTLVNLLKIARLLKGFKVFLSNSFVNKMHKSIKDNNILGKWMRLYVTFFIFACCIHLLASIFVFCGLNYYPNWIVSKHIDPKEHKDIYVASLYFIFATVFNIGYGDVVCNNRVERIFTLFLLIIGLMIYSWTISSLSTYYTEGDEKTNEYKKNTAILEDIRLTYDNMPFELYDKIQRYLLYRLNNDKIDCNAIYEALPIGLRNNLIYEMYKPIINNFIFFKNFNSTDFIIKVILSFKPLFALKNERLVNEGDVMEEIIFVKNGKLVLEFPLPLVLSPDFTKNLSKKLSLTLNPTNSFKDLATLSFLRKKGTKTFGIDDFDWKKQTSKRLTKRETKIDTEIHQQYVKLIEIRRNEHFGDILMFLNKRSPLSVKVKSKFAELFLLKKTDAVEISMSFPKIWRQIIKKSLFNMQQINRLINKSLKFFFIHYEGRSKTLISLQNDQIAKSQDGKTTFIKEMGAIKDIIASTEDELKSIPESKELDKLDNQQGVISERPPSEEETLNKSNFKASTKHQPQLNHIGNESLIDDDSSSFFESAKDQKIDLNSSNDTIKIDITHMNFNTKDFEKEETKKTTHKELMFDNMFGTNNSSGICLKYEPEEINNEYYPNETELKKNVQYMRETTNHNLSNQMTTKENILDNLGLIEDNSSFNSKETNMFKKKTSTKKKKPSHPQLLCLSEEENKKKVEQLPQINTFNYLEPSLASTVNYFSVTKKSSLPTITLQKSETIISNDNQKIDDATIITNQNISSKLERLEKTKTIKLRKCSSISSNFSPKKRRKFGSVIGSYLPNSINDNPMSINSINTSNTIIDKRKQSMILPINTNFLLKPKEIQSPLSPHKLSTKKTILQEISHNIQKNSLNLNNPEMFYSSMFARVLGEEKEKDDNKNLNKKLNDILKLLEDNEHPDSK